MRPSERGGGAMLHSRLLTQSGNRESDGSLKTSLCSNALGRILALLVTTVGVTQGQDTAYIHPSTARPISFERMINDCIANQTSMGPEECSHCTKCYAVGCFENPTGSNEDACSNAKCIDLPGCEAGAPFSDVVPLDRADMISRCSIEESSHERHDCNVCVECIVTDCFEKSNTNSEKCLSHDCPEQKDCPARFRSMFLSTYSPSTFEATVSAIATSVQPSTESETSIPTESTKPPKQDPTLSQMNILTKKPTGIPTNAPTVTPTTSPTYKPTPTTSPTTRPSPTPTPAPTAMPSTVPYNAPSTVAVCRKCERNGCFNSATQENRSKCEKFSCSTMVNCPTYKFVAPISSTDITTWTTTLPTKNPTISPTTQAEFSESPTSPPSTLETGMVCSTDLECISGVCRNGACMASPDCYPVKHAYGTSFHMNKVNLVFVASAFESEVQWRNEVNRTYRVFKRYRMFDESIAQLNVFYVNPSVLDPSFCSYFCVGISRLLCCEQTIAHSLSRKCFPEGANLQTVVIHNDNRYGGAGYADQNLATMSTHPQGALVAVHELGHSLFELADEYHYGPGTAKDPNCASSQNCFKWADLIGNTPQGYAEVTCEPGCRNGNYFVGESSYMDLLPNPVGAVNTRYSCCTYQALTKSLPHYCKVFDFEPGYLLNFCKSNDFQNYGRSNYDTNPKQSISIEPQDEDSKYIYVAEPLLLYVKLQHGSKRSAAVVDKPRPAQAGLYRRNQVHGDYEKMALAFANGVDSTIRVKVTYANGVKLLFFNRNITIDIPSAPYDEGNADREEPESVSEEVSILNVVLDTRGRMFKKAKAKLLERT